MSGGKIEIILEAVPHEFPMLMGGAIGAYIVGNSETVLKDTFKEIIKSFKGAKWKKQDYQDLLCLLFTVMQTDEIKGPDCGRVSISKSLRKARFSASIPHILHDHFAIDLICDTLRSLTMGMENPLAD